MLWDEILRLIKTHPRYLAIFAIAVLLPTLIRRKLKSSTLVPVNSTFPSEAASVVARNVPISMSFSQFLQNVEQKEVSNVLLHPKTLEFTLKSSDKTFFTSPTSYHPGIVELLHLKAIPFDEVAQIVEKQSFAQTLRNILPYILFPVAYLAFAIYFLRKFNPNDDPGHTLNQHNSKNSRSKSSANGSHSNSNVTKFEHIAGIGEAKSEVTELVSILQNPEKYQNIGARLPSGILLVGPPGTGKTMLARALANEANLPFFYCAASEFVEVYAGRGAARVRNLFEKANKSTPSIIFIDELDALGKARSAFNEFGNNEEREQTLNQLLSCIDGFASGTNKENGQNGPNGMVVVIGATNRYEMLDKALTRPGRFDRIVKVGLPDLEGRVEVLRVYLNKVAACNEVFDDLESVASLTPGFSAAELASLVNEAALTAVRENKQLVDLDDLLAAVYQFKVSRGRDIETTNTQGLVNQLFRGLNTKS